MPPKLSSALEGGLHAKFAPGSEELCGRSTPGVVFIAGTLVGVLACLFCLWLVVARRWGRRAWAKHTKRSAAELKRGCRVGRHGKVSAFPKGEPHQILILLELKLEIYCGAREGGIDNYPRPTVTYLDTHCRAD